MLKSRAARVFVVVLIVGAFLGAAASVLNIPLRLYWLAVFVVAAAAALAVGHRPGGGRSLFRGEFLCDSCKYNDPRYCSRPERPNATRCPDYKR